MTSKGVVLEMVTENRDSLTEVIVNLLNICIEKQDISSNERIAVVVAICIQGLGKRKIIDL